MRLIQGRDCLGYENGVKSIILDAESFNICTGQPHCVNGGSFDANCKCDCTGDQAPFSCAWAYTFTIALDAQGSGVEAHAINVQPLPDARMAEQYKALLVLAAALLGANNSHNVHGLLSSRQWQQCSAF